MYKINRYGRNEAKEYALKYALQKNPAYFDYTNQGGNCTNYISQCLYAGTKTMQISPSGWYYFSPSNTSVAWANVEPLYHFLTSNQGEGPYASKSPLEMAEIGDVIQLRFSARTIFRTHLSLPT